MKALMVVGTASQVGKSFVATAICRILSRQGWRVTPFKSENETTHAYVTPGGGEIAYAQALQAWAAGTNPRLEMNPVYLKPQGAGSQLILGGRPIGPTTRDQYYDQYASQTWQVIEESLRRLSEDFDLVVCEGSGSPVEITIMDRDPANLKLAEHLNAATLLVADSDRGGTFAQIIGTLELMTPEARGLIKGIIINKYRGSKASIQPGVDWLQARTGIPVLGVIPWLEDLASSEDSMNLVERRHGKSDLTIAIVRLPRVANYTDFDPLEAEPSVSIKYIGLKDSIGYPDAVILPGSKTTIPDMLILQKSGLAEEIKGYAAAGGTVLGICGGFQMMGRILADPEGIEGQEGRFNGLDLLPVRTLIAGAKIARQRMVTSNHPQTGLPVTGYELHHGRSQLLDGEDPKAFWPLFDDPSLGLVDASQSIWGTYLHGLFDNGPWRRAWLNRLRQQRGLKALPTGIANYRTQRESLLDTLANKVSANINLGPVLDKLS
jgi:adenosylcobyric acid synthase